MCWAWVCQECCWLCLGHLCPEPLTALGTELHQPETFVSCLYQMCHMQQCPVCTHAFPACVGSGSAEALTLPVCLCPRPSVHVESQPGLDLQQHRDSHSGPLQYIFWRQMLRSICPGEHRAVRDWVCWARGALQREYTAGKMPCLVSPQLLPRSPLTLSQLTPTWCSPET